MDRDALVVIHANLRLPNQCRTADALRRGAARHGHRVVVLGEPDGEPGDPLTSIHIVQGPHFAKRRWQGHPRTILLDRCFYGDPDAFVSLGWLRPDGGRTFPVDCPPDRWHRTRPAPPIREPMQREHLVLGDYEEQREAAARYINSLPAGAVTYRGHPHAEPWPACPAPVDQRTPLPVLLARHRKAYGWAGTALVAAALAGLEVRCADRRSVVWPLASGLIAPDRWCYDLAYANWSEAEVAAGDAWEVLCGLAANHGADGRAGQPE